MAPETAQGQVYPEKVNPERCVLAVGNPSDGFALYGPFDTPDDATSFAEQSRFSESWWVLDITTVQCDESGEWVMPNGT